MIDYDTIAEFDQPVAPGGVRDLPAPNTFVSQGPGLLRQDMTSVRRGMVAGAAQALPSFDYLRRPSFADEPDFNPYGAAIKRGNVGDIDVLRGARSQAEFDWISSSIEDDRLKRARDLGLSPQAAVAGALATAALYPSSYIPFAAPLRLASIARTVGVTALTMTAEEALATGMSSERSLEEATMNVAFGSAIAATLQGVLYAGNKIVRMKRGPEQMVEDAVRSEAQVGAIRGENSAVDPFHVRDPLSAEARSVGAAGTGAMPTDAERIWKNGIADAMGLEKVPDAVAPITRIMHSTDIPEVTELGELLLEVPYLLNKNRRGEATGVSVENTLRRTWRPLHAEWRRGLDTEYLEWLKERGEAPRLGTVLLSDMEQRTRGTGGDFGSFRRAVWEDMARGHVDSADWAPGDAVRRASRSTRDMYNRLVDDAMDLELHVKDLREQLRSVKDPAESARIKAEIQGRTDGINRNRDRFVNVIFDKEKIRSRRDDFVAFVQVKKRISRAEAEQAVDQVLQQAPFRHLDDSNRVGTPRSLHERTLVDDPLAWSEWLDTDVLNGGTLYMRTMSPDIELARAFGTADMGEQLADVAAAYETKIQAATTPAERARLRHARDERLEDLKAVRDLLRGTYMIPPDPEHPVSRAIRIAKNWNVATMLTGALAAVPDVARVVTANGLQKSFGSLFEALRNPALYKMAKSEARAVGEAWDMVLGTRAAVFADIGEAVGAFSRAERIAAEVGQQTFNLNLMNFWNETLKSASSLVISTKILSDVEALSRGKASPKVIARLAANGIDAGMARRMADEAANWHRTDHNIIAQASTWGNQAAADVFRAALSRELNIVILTPGVSERPLWMSQTLDKTLGIKGTSPSWLSQPYLSLVAQFKSFMMSSVYRTMIPALQQRDTDVIAMLAIATGIGVMIDQIRSRQGGYAPATDPFDAILSGLDRAGVMGWFLEPNNVIERLSGNTIGLRPLFGDAREYRPSSRTLAGVLAGPAGAQAANIAGIVTDVMGGEFDQYTAKAMRRVLPYQNTAHLDMVFDQVEAGIRGAGMLGTGAVSGDR